MNSLMKENEEGLEFTASAGGGPTGQLTHYSGVRINRRQTGHMRCGEPRMAVLVFAEVAFFSLHVLWPWPGPIISCPHTVPSPFSITQGVRQTQAAGPPDAPLPPEEEPARIFTKCPHGDF